MTEQFQQKLKEFLKDMLQMGTVFLKSSKPITIKVWKGNEIIHLINIDEKVVNKEIFVANVIVDIIKAINEGKDVVIEIK